MRFFFDHCVSQHIGKALAELDRKNEIEHLLKRFPEGAKDVEWLGALSEEGGWVIVSGDLRISRSPHEREIWRRSG